MSLWDNQLAEKATGGKASGTWQALRVEIDSRRVKAGDLFVAIRGENFDGHQFVPAALAAGAVSAVVSSPLPSPPPEGEGILYVSDTQKALEDLGRFGRGRARAKIIGVTG
ncbi:MAG: UDP-N-acetylmuramoylalanyl-D-glutamyl-2, 6-diaminopimelate--D-alanyl-D-alanine ligase, partial [Alphaproteobacteria bacterium]|nr:UDP-N-acetylmuramoylalanyl-D-glutamyl-2, 6-diaminopimelate--D-alanyl-D-alanine ligase [Alphaproteobacteria bacterium]